MGREVGTAHVSRAETPAAGLGARWADATAGWRLEGWGIGLRALRRRPHLGQARVLVLDAVRLVDDDVPPVELAPVVLFLQAGRKAVAAAG